MGRTIQIGLFATIASVVFSATASADIVWNQSPNQAGGYLSDTDYVFFGQPNQSQRMADDFKLNESAELTRVVFWGFYFDAIYGPPNETMRIRFYGARESDGLPDEGAMAYEQIVQDPSREETGELVQSLYPIPEYRFTIDLDAPVSVMASTSYWFEVIQLDDGDSDFAWESSHITSVQDNAAGNNATHPNWAYTAPRNGFAFQLLTPEPSPISLIVFCFFLPRRRMKREAGARSG